MLAFFKTWKSERLRLRSTSRKRSQKEGRTAVERKRQTRRHNGIDLHDACSDDDYDYNELDLHHSSSYDDDYNDDGSAYDNDDDV